MTDPIRILIVDDEFPIRISLTCHFEDMGFDTIGAESGEEALTILEKEKLDAAVVDMRLSGMDGNALILKAHEMQPDMKFLIYTGSTNYTIPPALLDIGMSKKSVYHKPQRNMNILVDAVLKALNRKESDCDDNNS